MFCFFFFEKEIKCFVDMNVAKINEYVTTSYISRLEMILHSTDG